MDININEQKDWVLIIFSYSLCNWLVQNGSPPVLSDNTYPPNHIYILQVYLGARPWRYLTWLCWYLALDARIRRCFLLTLAWGSGQVAEFSTSIARNRKKYIFCYLTEIKLCYFSRINLLLIFNFKNKSDIWLNNPLLITFVYLIRWTYNYYWALVYLYFTKVILKFSSTQVQKVTVGRSNSLLDFCVEEFANLSKQCLL